MTAPKKMRGQFLIRFRVMPEDRDAARGLLVEVMDLLDAAPFVDGPGISGTFGRDNTVRKDAR